MTDVTPDACPHRRRLLKGLAAGLLLPVAPAWATAGAGGRELAFRNLHTGERLRAEYHDGGDYLADGMGEINRVLRDHRTGEVYGMDTGLMDLLHELHARVGASGEWHVISGYRSPKTNASLASKSNGVAKRSLHMQGKAIDVRLPGVDTAKLREAAIEMRVGGVGYYRRSDFVHLDVGRFRTW